MSNLAIDATTAHGISVAEFFNHDQMKIDIFINKYVPANDRTSSPEEIDIAEFFHKMCANVASVREENDADFWIERWKSELLSDKWRPGGSIMSGMLSNDRKVSLFNCTTIPIEGDSLEDIFKSLYSCSKAAAHRQGLGVDFSKLRARGMNIRNSAEVSQGPVHWMRLFNHIGDSVGQLGRRPAMLFSLRVDHPDIEEFISCKDDLNEINNANISVQITDDFMKAVEADGTFVCRFVNEETGESKEKIVRARDLLSKISEHAWKTGEPGVQFIDLMKKNSIQEALEYKIISTNACSEKPLPPYSICGLLSLNMAKVPHINQIDKMKNYLENICYSVVRFMDNVISYEIEHEYKSPLKEQMEIIKDLREVGIGVTNIHRWLFDQNIIYDSDEAVRALDEFFKWFRYYLFRATIRLARERGSCRAWDNLRSNGQLSAHITPYLRDVFSMHPDIERDYYAIGIRNGALLSIAPTGSISMTFGDDVLSSGIEPAIGWYYWRRTRAVNKGKWDYYFVVPNTVKNILLDRIPKDSIDYELISQFPGSVLDNDGSIGERYVKVIEKYLDISRLKSVYNVDPFVKLRLISTVQRYVDGAISVTFNLPSDTDVNTIESLYAEAHRLGVKAVSVFRDGSREGILFMEFPHRERTSGSVTMIEPTRPDDLRFVFAPRRPVELPAEVHYLLRHNVVVGLYNEKPYEIFIVDIDGKKLPSTGYVKKIRKNRKKLYYFCDEDGNELVCLNDSEVSNDEIQAITRLVSSNLRHGVPIDFICQQLSKCGSSISSYPKMLSRALKKYRFLVQQQVSSDVICPNCGEQLIEHDGCIQCLGCGYAKCS
jgi:ribonucleoside-diphosphate reductase alpha chain